MNLGLTGVLQGLPGLIGVLAGIALYAKSPVLASIGLPAIFLVSLILVLFLSRKLFISYPRMGLFLLELWVLSAICIVALCTQLILWLTVESPTWFDLDKGRLDAVTGALVGALTTYLATIWTKDVQDSKGPLLASTQFQQFLAVNFSTSHDLKGDTAEVEACSSDAVRTGVTGWGFMSRWRRAKILSEYLKRSKQHK